jgi:hypothetical protein
MTHEASLLRRHVQINNDQSQFETAWVNKDLMPDQGFGNSNHDVEERAHFLPCHQVEARIVQSQI